MLIIIQETSPSLTDMRASCLWAARRTWCDYLYDWNCTQARQTGGVQWYRNYRKSKNMCTRCLNPR